MDEGAGRGKGTAGDDDNHASISEEENMSENSGAPILKVSNCF